MTQAHTEPAASGNSTAGTPHMVEPTGDELLDFVLKELDEDQAQEVVTIDLAGKSSIADHMVIASGRSTRQVASIAQKLAEKLKQNGYGPVKLEGLPAADWVLLDAGDIVVHLFRPEVRSFYNLERMWAFGDAPPVGRA